MHEEMDVILRNRAAPQMRSHLPERIIAAAQLRDRERRNVLSEIMDVFGDIFLLPRPAYALATVLVFGLVTGFYLKSPPQPSFSPVAMQAELTSFMTAEMSFYDGDFL